MWYCGKVNQVQVLGRFGRPLRLEVMLDMDAWVIKVLEDSSSLALCKRSRDKRQKIIWGKND